MKRVVLESIEGVEIYPIISLIIFVGMFTVAMYYVIRMDKNTVNEIASMPLNNDVLNDKNLNNEKK